MYTDPDTDPALDFALDDASDPTEHAEKPRFPFNKPAQWLAECPVLSVSEVFSQIPGAPPRERVAACIKDLKIGPVWLVTYEGAPWEHKWFGGDIERVREAVSWWLEQTGRADRVKVGTVTPFVKKARERRRRRKSA